MPLAGCIHRNCRRLPVHFESNGGTEYTDRIVRCGQLLTPPEDPKRPGYSFTGWFRNAELTEIWDFENEIIGEDLTLYAGWTKDENSAISADATKNGPGWLWLIMLMPLLTLLLLLLIRHKVHFDTAGAEEIRDRFVFGSSLVEMPAVPNLPGHVFMGWYRDKELTMQWDFEKDKVTESMTLYAKWN